MGVKRIRVSVRDLTTGRVQLGTEVVTMRRSGREWVSGPISDEAAEIAAQHGIYMVEDHDSGYVPDSLTWPGLDLTNRDEVDHYLRFGCAALPLDDIAGAEIPLTDALGVDELRELVRREVTVAVIARYVDDPAAVLSGYVVATADQQVAFRKSRTASQQAETTTSPPASRPYQRNRK